MAYVVNVAITDTFVLRDNTNTAITGKVSGDFATVEAYQISTPGTTAAVTLTEIGAGEYRISFTPTTPTTGSDLEWTAHLVYNSGGVFREFSESYSVSSVASTVVTVGAATSGSLTQTFAQLIERVARRLGDYEPLTATSNGTTTTFIDTLGINTATEDMKGRMLITSDGTAHRVTVFTDSTGTITFTPAVASSATTASGQTAYLLNKRGKGFRLDEYKHAINAAINDAFPLGVIELYDDAVATFDRASPSITVPANFTHVHTVSWTDSDGFLHAIPRASSTNESGWIADAAQGKIRILGGPGWYSDGLAINLTGYGRQGELSAMADTCALNAEYIVARACYHLCYGALDKDQKFQQAATTYLNESMKLRSRIRKDKRPGTVSVRAA